MFADHGTLPKQVMIFKNNFSKIITKNFQHDNQIIYIFGTENGVANLDSSGIMNIATFCSDRVTVGKGNKDEKEERNTAGDT